MTKESLYESLNYVPFARVFFRRRLDAVKRPKNVFLSAIIELGSLCLLYWLLSPAFAAPLYDRLLFHPFPEREDLSKQIDQMADFFHCTFQQVQFKAPDGETLHGWYFLRKGSRKTIMMSHGNAGSIEARLPLCPLLLQTGSSVFLYDYEGFGKSTGTPTVVKCLDDTVAAFDYLTEQQHLKPSSIVLYGESIGTGFTSELSTKRKAGAIILQSPFTSLPDVARDNLFYLYLYPTGFFPKPHLSSIEIMSRPHAPLLIIHGKQDSTLKYRYSEQIMESALEQKTLLLLPDANHADIFEKNVDLTMPAINKFIAGLPD
jgi:pimeloyl-ACP methyl ester carboxylesterase